MYKCNDCGFMFDEKAEWEEDRGECFGFPAKERMTGCPNCYGSDYEEKGDDEE